MRIMDLTSWPPVGWTTNLRCGSSIALPMDHVIIGRVARVLATYVVLYCTFEGSSVYYDFEVDDPKRSEELADIFRANIGLTLNAIETIEIDDWIDQEIAS